METEDAKYLKESIMFIFGYITTVIGLYMAFGPVPAGIVLIIFGMLFVVHGVKGAIDKGKGADNGTA